jgi:hypothetical protein
LVLTKDLRHERGVWFGFYSGKKVQAWYMHLNAVNLGNTQCAALINGVIEQQFEFIISFISSKYHFCHPKNNMAWGSIGTP